MLGRTGHNATRGEARGAIRVACRGRAMMSGEGDLKAPVVKMAVRGGGRKGGVVGTVSGEEPSRNSTEGARPAPARPPGWRFGRSWC